MRFFHPCVIAKQVEFTQARCMRSLCLTFLLSAACLIAAAAEPLDLRDGDRVVFLGNSFFERALDYGYLETELTLRHKVGAS